MTQPQIPNPMQQLLQQTGGALPQVGQQLNFSTTQCECCERFVPTPYTHADHNPPYATWSYCQECYDAGCSGPNGYCELDIPDTGVCVVCKKVEDLDGMAFEEHPWCDDCYEKYQAYLKTHPIPPKNRFDPRNLWVDSHPPAYRVAPDDWPSIGFDPQHILNPAAAPAPTRKKAHIVSQQQSETQEDMMRRLIAEQLGQVTGANLGDEVTLDDILEQIDPRDSDSALKLFNWLRDNARLHKVATLDQGGYLFLYQEPDGSSRQGYVAGGTQGDQIVDNALEKAQAAGGKPNKGLCRLCYSPIVQVGDNKPEAESPRPGTDPAECPAADGGSHVFAG